MLNDLRYALRQLAKHPGFTLVAVLTLALGIGPTTAIFSLIYGVLLRPLPYREPDRLVRPTWHWQLDDGGGTDALTSTQYEFWKEHNRVFAGIAAYAPAGAGFNILAGGQPAYVPGEFISADLIPLLGVPPEHGRNFLAEEDEPNGPSVALVSDRLWRQRLGADPDAVGRTLVVNGTEHTVVGVMPPAFAVDGQPADLWLPLRLVADPRNQGHNTMTIARLRDGVSLEQAQAEMGVLLAALREAVPGHVGDNEVGVILEPYHARLVGEVRPILLLLMGAVALVLLIATANVAALVLGRAATREQEIAVRAALGASRSAAARPLVIESVALSLAGGVLGVLFADWSLRALVSMSPTELPWSGAVQIDVTVLGVAFAMSAVIGVLAGIPPALRRARNGLHATARGGSRELGSIRQRARSVLVGGQLALSTALLAGAILVIVSVTNLWNSEAGFDTDGRWAIQMSLPPAQYPTEEDALQFSREVRQRLATFPGVSTVAAASSLPLERGLNLWIQAMSGGAREGQTVEARTVSPGYFRALGIMLVRGRGFEETDTGDSPHVVVINRRLADRFWADRNPIGESVWIGGMPAQIVGVSEDVRDVGLDQPAPRLLYLPESQVPPGLAASIRQWFLSSWIVESTVPLSRAEVAREIHAVDPAQPVVAVRPLTQVVTSSLQRRRFVGRLLDVFAVLALVLAAVGVYGVVSYSVGQRRRELGLRAALGARRDELIRMVLGQGMRLAVGGTLVGVGLAFVLTRFLRDFLYGVDPANPVVLAGTCVGLATVAVLASFVPAYRAARVDPMEALRSE